VKMTDLDTVHSLARDKRTHDATAKMMVPNTTLAIAYAGPKGSGRIDITLTSQTAGQMQSIIESQSASISDKIRALGITLEEESELERKR